MSRFAAKNLSNQEPDGLAKLATIMLHVETHKFLGALSACSDILSQQSEVNRECQRENIHFKRVADEMAKAVSELKQTYIDSEQIGGNAFNTVRAAMLNPKAIDDAVQKTIDNVNSSMKDVAQSVIIRAVPIVTRGL